MKKDDNIDPILADIMMVLLVVMLMVMVTMDFVDQQQDQHAETYDERQSPESVELPTNEENQQAVTEGLVIQMQSDYYKLAYNGQTHRAEQTGELSELIDAMATEDSPEVIVLAEGRANFNEVISTLEEIDAMVSWTIPEVGILE